MSALAAARERGREKLPKKLEQGSDQVEAALPPMLVSMLAEMAGAAQ